MQIQTVKLENKKTGEKKIRNKADYAAMPEGKDWKIASSFDPATKVAPTLDTSKVTAKDIDWRTLRWPAARTFIREKTGTYPSTKAHAEELMSE
jgi:hypothetical protein